MVGRLLERAAVGDGERLELGPLAGHETAVHDDRVVNEGRARLFERPHLRLAVRGDALPLHHGGRRQRQGGVTGGGNQAAATRGVPTSRKSGKEVRSATCE